MKMNKILFFTLVAALLSVGFTSCNKNKKVVDNNTEVTDTYADVKSVLNSLISGNSNMTLEEREKKLAEIKSKGITDQTVVNLIKMAEDKIVAERKEYEAKKEEEKRENENKVIVLSANEQFTVYLNEIAAAPTQDVANQTIAKALGMFSSPDALVLIIVYKQGDVVDYDRPTTIKEYLNWVKDQKKVAHNIDKLIQDPSGKIKEIELINK